MANDDLPRIFWKAYTRFRNLIVSFLLLGGIVGCLCAMPGNSTANDGKSANLEVPSTRSSSELAAIQEIKDVIYRYCRAADRWDAELALTVWHEGGTIDLGDGRGEIPATTFAAIFTRQMPEGFASSHQITNILIDFDGDRANSESYVTANIRRTVEGKISHNVTIARYLDQWSFRNGRWAIDQRKAVLDIIQSSP